MRRPPTRRRRVAAAAVLGLTALLGVNVAATAPAASAAVSPSPVVTPQIVGGQIAPEGAWRSQTVLLNKYEGKGPYQLLCGATLIASRWVLTAAHCVDGIKARQVKAAVGIQWLPGITRADRLTVDRVVMHPRYDPGTLGNDIALLRLAKPHPGPYARLIGKAQDGKWGTKSLATVTGWGLTSDSPDGLMSNQLRQADVPIVSDAACAKSYGELNPRLIICAGWPKGGRDSCGGDSGGPLWVPIGRTWYQVGIVSLGIGCARPGIPGVYSEVRNLRGFISATVKPST